MNRVGQRGNRESSNTKIKLSEAKYFFLQMKCTEKKPRELRHNLSAFVSAARSVTLMMQKEYGKVFGFDQWYSDKQENELNVPLCKKFNSLRTFTIHTKSISPSIVQAVNFGSGVTVPPGGALYIEMDSRHVMVQLEGVRNSDESSEKSREQLSQTTVRSHYELGEFPGLDLFGVCEEYLTLLEKLVLDCEKNFALSQDSGGKG